MRGLFTFMRDQRGASAAEFALVLPIFLLFLLGMIDVGRFVWSFNKLEKATQTGARWAVATDLIPGGLASYSFAIDGGIAQGTIVPKTNFPGVQCTGTTTTATCTCKAGGTCGFPLAANATAFSALLTRMQEIDPAIAATNLTVDYDWSGLGFSGDPNGPDVAPIVTVTVQNLQFPMFFMLGRAVSLPKSRYAMTLEDGQGTDSN